MIQELINKFNDSKGAKFVAFEFTNRFGEVSKRLVQINTVYLNAVQQDHDINIPNAQFEEGHGFDRATFILAQSELLKSAKMKLGVDKRRDVTKEEKDKFTNRSNGQKNAYVQIAKNVQFNVEKQQLVIWAKEIRKAIVTEGDYPPNTNKQDKTKAKDFINKKCKASKYRKYPISNIESVVVGGEEITLD